MISSHAAAAVSTTPLQHAMPSEGLKLLVMDDSSFDRRAISRYTKKSRYNLEMIEATSIADARAKLAEENPDVVFLDFRVPDGDGIEFSAEITSSMKENAPPVVIVTGEGDERAAIRSFRSGVVDYLAKDTLSTEVFDDSIRRCLATRPANSSKLMDEMRQVSDELMALQEATQRNMHLARAFLMPMADYAWRSVTPLEGPERRGEAQKLFKITQRLTGFLDETLIDAVTAGTQGRKDLVDLGEEIETMIDSTPEIAEYVAVSRPDAFPTLAANRPQIQMLLKELVSEALTSVPAKRKPEVRLHPAADPNSNPILCITDNGIDLAERKQSLSQFVRSVADNGAALPGKTTRMSICQKLAEMNGGQLRMAQADGGGCIVMIRFSKGSSGLH